MTIEEFETLHYTGKINIKLTKKQLKESDRRFAKRFLEDINMWTADEKVVSKFGDMPKESGWKILGWKIRKLFK